MSLLEPGNLHFNSTQLAQVSQNDATVLAAAVTPPLVNSLRAGNRHQQVHAAIRCSRQQGGWVQGVVRSLPSCLPPLC